MRDVDVVWELIKNGTAISKKKSGTEIDEEKITNEKEMLEFLIKEIQEGYDIEDSSNINIVDWFFTETEDKKFREKEQELISQEEIEKAREKMKKEESKEKPKEMVNHPKHYDAEDAPCECIDAIHYIVKGLPPEVAFSVGNTVKYLWRLGKKEPDAEKGQTIEQKILEDLKKSNWYTNDAIKEMEKKI